ncbi:MAG: FKBP-type peptidyl-prolyl cis-trans isomerase [Halobacteriovoraceae bacterium]|nr:FKBP-type peptidyl-prolyl cis-trans isomerase [Halobacteriovoraceae bacterium]
MKKIIILTTLISFAFVSCNDKKAEGSKSASSSSEMSSENSKIFYALAYEYGKKLKKLNPNNSDLDHFFNGLKDSTYGSEPKVDIAEYTMKAGELIEQENAKVASVNIEKGKSFIEDKLASGEFKKSESGLLYKIEKTGSSKKKLNDKLVKISFVGKKIDNTVFDKTSPNNIPRYPYDGLIPAWKEALSLIGIGGEISIIAPSDLAYGDRGAPPKIQGGETVMFEMKLHGVENKE